MISFSVSRIDIGTVSSVHPAPPAALEQAVQWLLAGPVSVAEPGCEPVLAVSHASRSAAMPLGEVVPAALAGRGLGPAQQPAGHRPRPAAPSRSTSWASASREYASVALRTAATNVAAVPRSSARRVYGVTDSASTCR